MYEHALTPDKATRSKVAADKFNKASAKAYAKKVVGRLEHAGKL